LQLLDPFIRLFALEQAVAEHPPHESGASNRNGKSTGQPGKALKRFLCRSITCASRADPSFTSVNPVRAANPFRAHLIIRALFNQNVNFYEIKIFREDKGSKSTKLRSWLPAKP